MEWNLIVEMKSVIRTDYSPNFKIIERPNTSRKSLIF